MRSYSSKLEVNSQINVGNRILSFLCNFVTEGPSQKYPRIHSLVARFSIQTEHFALAVTSNHGFTKPDVCPPRKTDTVRDGKNGKKRTCPRKCSTDSDCLNDRKLCLCDGACGMSCIRPEKECPELPDPPHGQVGTKHRIPNTNQYYTTDFLVCQ